MRGGTRSPSSVLPSLVLTAALIVTACSKEAHKEAMRSGSLPIDTAALMPVPGGNGGIGSDSANASGGAPGSTDSAVAATYGMRDAPVSVVPVADSTAGHAIFHGKGRCFTCHGERGQGTPRLGSTLADDSWLSGNGSLAWIADVIEHGVAIPAATSAAMPAYSGMLSAREIELAAAYVYTLSHPNATVPGGTGAGTPIDSAPRGTAGKSPDAARAMLAPSHHTAPPPGSLTLDSRGTHAARPIRQAVTTSQTGTR